MAVLPLHFRICEICDGTHIHTKGMTALPLVEDDTLIQKKRARKGDEENKSGEGFSQPQPLPTGCCYWIQKYVH